MPSVAIDSITISDRQRKELGDLTSLKASIELHGRLINPIVITRDHVLIAGERRWTCCKQLGWTHIEVNYWEDLDPIMQRLVELDENRNRRDLTVIEEHDAIVGIFDLRRQIEPTVTQTQVAQDIGLHKSAMSQHLFVEEWRSRDPRVEEALKRGFMAAYNTAVRVRDILDADTRAAISHALLAEPAAGPFHDLIAPDQIDGLATKHTHMHTATRTASILHADFRDWAPTYTGPLFNLIHCDFPYGIDAHDYAGQNSANPGGYDDSPATWERLCRTFTTHLDRFCAPSAHLIFWFHPKRYRETWEMLTALPGFQFDEPPLIWRRGENEGIAPRHEYGPRRVYEMAFFGWRGGRKLPAGPKANIFKAPTERDIHSSEKSQAMLEHFFSMLVGPTTRLLDPTCGSGSALRAAWKLDVPEMLGIEIKEDYAADARRALRRVQAGE
jgi:ParB/RepB/Spo0J family partition protein